MSRASEPDHDEAGELRAALEAARDAAAPVRDGAVAGYIPELARVPADLFAIAACTVDATRVALGDAGRMFTLQSICKPFLYACAREELGRRQVLQHVGVEPTGDAFNSIIRLESGTNRPHNPMINAGAIAVASLLGGGPARLTQLLERMAACFGRGDVIVDTPVYLSERDAGDRNRAIAHLMNHFRMLRSSVQDALELYFQACSISASVTDLAAAAATLAAGGVNPLTHERVFSRDCVRDVLAVMFTCGLYDHSGQFVFDVGLPAKSGVCGAIMAVVPGRMGLAAFSPRLDAKGNSVRALRALQQVSTSLALHTFQPAPREPAFSIVGARRFADDESTLQAALHAASEAQPTEAGRVADYIPELAAARPDAFALAICTADGRELSVGDAAAPFTIQSAANPFTYALALQTHGLDAVHERVGCEPSGNPFNAILLDPATQRPYNPLSNSGAIAVASMLPGGDSADRLRRLLEWFAALAGGVACPVDVGVLASEGRAGERNRAIAHLLRNFGVIREVEPALELYFQQCSIRVNARLLARMGATLAVGGRPPCTRRPVLAPELVRPVLSVMYTCGMHDASGRFAYELGFPAKSAISGGIVGVVPGRMGVAVYSPPVDAQGSSVRGVAALRILSERLGLDVLSQQLG